MNNSKQLTREPGCDNVLRLRCEPIEQPRIGFVGVGVRGQRAVARMMHIEGAVVAALCDFIPENIERSCEVVEQLGGQRPEIFSGEEGWRELCQSDGVDLVYICTDWESHAEIAIHAMECRKHVAMEVPAAMSVEDCWRLVDTAERTRRHCMMLENCVYDRFELSTLNMVQQGALGNLIHAEASYIHDLRHRIATNDEGNRRWKNWQVDYMSSHTANIYPTHGLGPVALALGIHRGDRMKSLVSVSSRMVGNEAQSESLRGTMNSSIITTEQGRTILLQHCIALPRAYSRSYLLSGTEGYLQKYPVPVMLFDAEPEHILTPEECGEVIEKYSHPFIEQYEARGREICGQRWIDFVMDSRLIYCLRNGLPLDMDVYDAAEWSSLTELTELSAAQGGQPVEIPDFTRGEWAKLSGVEFATTAE